MLLHYLVKCKWSSVQLYIHISKNITLYVRRHLFYESLLVYLSFLPDTDVIMTISAIFCLLRYSFLSVMKITFDIALNNARTTHPLISGIHDSKHACVPKADI